MVRAVVLGLIIGLLSASDLPMARAAAGASIPATPEQLHKILTTVIAAAPAYFVSLRGSVRSTVANGTFFNLTPAFAKICPGCDATDEFATAQTDERFVMQGNWPLPLRTTLAQKAAFVQKTFAPLTKGYSYKHGKNDDGELWFQWEKGSPTTFVYLETYHSKTTSGIQMRIGHFVSANVNYVPWARLTPAQRTDLTNGVVELVTAGEAAGAGNFASLRGAATDKDNNYFHVNQTFGTVLTGCDVDGVFSNLGGSSGGTGKWILECDTPPLGNPKADVLELLRSAIASALTDNFTATTDPKYLQDSAYRWDRSSDAISVEISSYDNSDGTATYHITIYHYIT
jgi:hypothetical protein